MNASTFTIPASAKRHISPATLSRCIEQFQSTGPCVVCGQPLGEGRFALLTARHDDGRWLLGAAHEACRSVPADSVRSTIESGSSYEARTFTHGHVPCLLLHPSVNTAVLARGQSLMQSLVHRGEWARPDALDLDNLAALAVGGTYSVLPNVRTGDGSGVLVVTLWGAMMFECHASAEFSALLSGGAPLLVYVTLRGPVVELRDQDDLDAVMSDSDTMLTLARPQH